MLSAAPWAPLAVAFLVGLACGWLLWGLKGAGDDSGEKLAAAAPDEGDERKEIVVLRAELEAARALLNDGEDNNQEELGQQLSALDEALKRANGRLKVLLRAVKR
jgi:hypothetical protein